MITPTCVKAGGWCSWALMSSSALPYESSIRMMEMRSSHCFGRRLNFSLPYATMLIIPNVLDPPGFNARHSNRKSRHIGVSSDSTRLNVWT